MRKLLLSVAAVGAALAAAAPASAQYYPQPQPYGYGYGYGANNYGQVRALQARVDRLQWQINMLDRRNVIRDREADRLRGDANQIERRLRSASRYGLNPYEANDIQARLARLEQRIQYASNDRRYRRGDRDDRRDWNEPYGGRNVIDRDHNGLDDRFQPGGPPRYDREDRDDD